MGKRLGRVSLAAIIAVFLPMAACSPAPHSAHRVMEAECRDRYPYGAHTVSEMRGMLACTSEAMQGEYADDRAAMLRIEAASGQTWAKDDPPSVPAGNTVAGQAVSPRFVRRCEPSAPPARAGV